MKKIIIAVVVIIAVATISCLIFVKRPVFLNKIFQKAASEPVIISSGFGGQLFEKIQQNPADKLTETNPFRKGLNPYEDAYVNPFK